MRRRHPTAAARRSAAALSLLLAALLACCAARPAAAGHKAGKVPLPRASAVTAAGAAAPPLQLLAGAEAVASMGADLDAVAEYYDKSASELTAVLLRDRNLRIDSVTRELVYTCNFPPPPATAKAAGFTADWNTSVEGPVTSKANGQLPTDPHPPPSQWNTLHSRPGSSKVIFLDFRGCSVSAGACARVAWKQTAPASHCITWQRMDGLSSVNARVLLHACPLRASLQTLLACRCLLLRIGSQTASRSTRLPTAWTTTLPSASLSNRQWRTSGGRWRLISPTWMWM